MYFANAARVRAQDLYIYVWIYKYIIIHLYIYILKTFRIRIRFPLTVTSALLLLKNLIFHSFHFFLLLTFRRIKAACTIRWTVYKKVSESEFTRKTIGVWFLLHSLCIRSFYSQFNVNFLLEKRACNTTSTECAHFFPCISHSIPLKGVKKKTN